MMLAILLALTCGTQLWSKKILTDPGAAAALAPSPILGAIAQLGAGRTTYGVTLAVAERFERPIGIATSGAFDVGQSAALSSGAFVQRAVGVASVVEGSLEIAHHRTQADLALSAPSFVSNSKPSVSASSRPTG